MAVCCQWERRGVQPLWGAVWVPQKVKQNYRLTQRLHLRVREHIQVNRKRAPAQACVPLLTAAVVRTAEGWGQSPTPEGMGQQSTVCVRDGALGHEGE